MKTSTRLSQIASVECSKKPPHNGSQFTLMLLFISGQMIFCCLTIVNFGKKTSKRILKRRRRIIDILDSVLITSLLDDGATTLKAIELTIELQLKPGSSIYFERKIKDYIYLYLKKVIWNMDFDYERTLNQDEARPKAKEQLTFTLCMQYFVCCCIFIVDTLDILDI